MDENKTPESLVDFKNSFSYSSRTDLNFKFLKSLSEEQAADFFQGLLWKLGDFMNDGDGQRLVEHIRAGQTAGYGSPSAFKYDEGPFVKMTKPVSASRIGVISSTGHFLKGDDPEPLGVKNMSQQEAIDRIGDFLREAPQLSAVPFGTTGDEMTVRHGGYDIRSGEVDANSAMPLQRMPELVAAGKVGSLPENAYSFVGAASQMRILNKVGPQWVEQFKADGMEGAILVPV